MGRLDARLRLARRAKDNRCWGHGGVRRAVKALRPDPEGLADGHTVFEIWVSWELGGLRCDHCRRSASVCRLIVWTGRTALGTYAQMNKSKLWYLMFPVGVSWQGTRLFCRELLEAHEHHAR